MSEGRSISSILSDLFGRKAVYDSEYVYPDPIETKLINLVRFMLVLFAGMVCSLFFGVGYIIMNGFEGFLWIGLLVCLFVYLSFKCLIKINRKIDRIEKQYSHLLLVRSVRQIG